MSGKVLIAQGGGPTAVINQSLAGAALEARKHDGIDAVYGALYGVRGIVDEAFLDLSKESAANLEAVARTPSSALGSTRDKPDAAYCEAIFRSLKAHDIRWFLYIGGNDSADVVRIVSEQAGAENYRMRAIHIPKTIDNDLACNDHTPGYGSAARFVAQAFMGADLDNRSLPGVYIGVVMGRHAGFLTAAAGLGRRSDEDGPHLIYLPERPFDQQAFLKDVERVNDRLGRCVIAVSEGIHDGSGKPFVTHARLAEYDPHGNISLSGTGALADMLAGLVKDNLGLSRVRADTFGYLQRSFAGCVSDVDQREARQAGEEALRLALEGDADGSLTLQRTGDYEVGFELVPLEDVAAKTRVMPDEFIARSGTDVSQAFLDYLRPLVGSDLPAISRLDGRNRVKPILGGSGSSGPS
jgi:6-phosphofructokinase 1